MNSPIKGQITKLPSHAKKKGFATTEENISLPRNFFLQQHFPPKQILLDSGFDFGDSCSGRLLQIEGKFSPKNSHEKNDHS